MVDLKGAIITIDAMGTQTAIADQIANGGGDYVLALKGNQDSLHQQAIDYIEQHISNDFADVPSQRLDEKEKKGHGRIDSRTYIQFNVPNTFTGNLDERIESYLQTFRLYKGPGVSIIFDAGRISEAFSGHADNVQFAFGVGIIIHEVAHVIDAKSWIEAHSHNSSGVDRREVEHLKYVPHGARFVRAALHLWHRVNLATGAFMQLPSSAIEVAGSNYAMSPVTSYELMLRDEFNAKLNQPIGDILLTPFPKLFSMLWNDDLTRTNGVAGAN
jgi:hypothetical protein